MKLSSLLFAIFCFALPFSATAQDHSTERTISKEDQIAQQQGEVDAFRSHLFRFEVALDEADQESATVLYGVLYEAMHHEIMQAADAPTGDDFLLPIRHRKLTLYNDSAEWKYAASDDHSKVKNAFKRFADEMQHEVDFMKQ